MDSAVDLSARTGGLLPLWLFLILTLLWLGAIVLAFRFRDHRWPELPRGLIAIGFLVLGNILFFWRPLFTGAHVPGGGGDLNSFFFTLHAYSADRISSGELPFWNPNLHGGMPHLGNFQAGVLYPPNLIAYFVEQPFSYGTLEWLAILHFLIASIGVYLLLRALEANRIGSVAAGLIFAYAGFMVAHLGHYSMISTAAWLPWLFWAIVHLVGVPSWGRTASLGLLVFLTASGGHQQTLLFAVVGSGLWWLFLTARQFDLRVPGVGSPGSDETGRDVLSRVWTWPGLIRLSQLALAFGAGVAIAAPMILPSLRLAQNSVRSTLSYEQASEFSVRPVALLQLVLPTVFGSNPTDHWGVFTSGEIWGYAGAVTLVLALLGVLLRQSPYRLFFALLGALALVYALGSWAPLHGWFYQFVPLFDLIRAPARAYLFLNLSLAVLAGLAISDLSRHATHLGIASRRILTRAVQLLAVIIGTVGLVVLPIFYARVLGVDDPPNRPVIAVDNLWMLLTFLGLLLAVLWLARNRTVRGAALGCALVAVVVLDLFSATMPFNPTDQDLVAGYREPEIAGFLRDQWDANGPFRIDVRHPGLLPNFGAQDGIHLAAGVYDPMQPSAYTSLHNLLAENPERPGYDMLNVRYRVQPADSDVPEGFEQVFESSAGNRVLEQESALPRAWFVSGVANQGRDAALAAIQEPSFDPAETVIIPNPPVSPDGAASGSVAIQRYEAERIELDVDVDGEGYLVVADGYYPGWTAEVDGQTTSIYEANAGLRAVAVDEGAERVVLQYEPPLVAAGLVLSALGVVAFAVLGMLAFWTPAWPRGRE